MFNLQNETDTDTTHIETQIFTDDKDNLQALVTCPVSRCIFKNPVMLNSGHTFEEAILRGLSLCPNTREPITSRQKNWSIVALVDVFLNKYPEEKANQYVAQPLEELLAEPEEELEELDELEGPERLTYAVIAPDPPRPAWATNRGATIHDFLINVAMLTFICSVIGMLILRKHESKGDQAQDQQRQAKGAWLGGLVGLAISILATPVYLYKNPSVAAGCLRSLQSFCLVDSALLEEQRRFLPDSVNV